MGGRGVVGGELGLENKWVDTFQNLSNKSCVYKVAPPPSSMGSILILYSRTMVRLLTEWLTVSCYIMFCFTYV